MSNTRNVGTILIIALVSTALALCAIGLSKRPPEIMGFRDKNENGIPDDCEKASHRFALKSWPVSPQGRLLSKGGALRPNEDQLFFCGINDSSYWAIVYLTHDFPLSSSRPRFVIYDLAHTEVDTLRANVMSPRTIQAAGILRRVKPPLVLKACIEGDTLYAYLRH